MSWRLLPRVLPLFLSCCSSRGSDVGVVMASVSWTLTSCSSSPSGQHADRHRLRRPEREDLGFGLRRLSPLHVCSRRQVTPGNADPNNQTCHEFIGHSVAVTSSVVLWLLPLQRHVPPVRPQDSPVLHSGEGQEDQTVGRRQVRAHPDARGEAPPPLYMWSPGNVRLLPLY